MTLYRFNGVGFEEEKKLSQDAEGNFVLSINYDEAKMRYVGSKTQDVIPLILKPGEDFTVAGKCGQLRNATTAGSPTNDAYRALKTGFQTNNGQFSTATRAHLKAARDGDSTGVTAALKQLKALDAKKLRTLTESTTNEPILGRIAALNTYQSFLTANGDQYTNEIDYFANTYFQYVDFQDEGYNDLPWTYESSRNYVNTLSGAIKGDQLGDLLLRVYDQWPDSSRAQLFAMSGAFSSLVQKKHPAAMKIADAIIGRFADSQPAAVAGIRQRAAGLRSFAIGAEAPTFSGENPQGETIALESLRGKVVLIDFWASWCGPCRRENPNVVRVYDAYKDRGFEILGVSLDRNRDRWVKAIADDRLTWPQISDLRGWQSAVARQYGVSSIPQTVLLDAEGRILARNLRGAALEQKLAQVLAGK